MHTYIHILWDFLFALIRQNCIYQMIYRSIPLHYKFHLLLTKWPSIQWQISFHPNPLTLIVICCFIVSLFAVSDANVSLLYSVSASSTPFQQADEWQYYDSIKPILKYSSTAASIYLLFPIDICFVSVKLQSLFSTLVYDANLKAIKTKACCFIYFII